MSDDRLLSQLSREELLARAAEYWRMSATATTPDIRDTLVWLAEQFEALAEVCEESCAQRDPTPVRGAGPISCRNRMWYSIKGRPSVDRSPLEDIVSTGIASSDSQRRDRAPARTSRRLWVGLNIISGI